MKKQVIVKKKEVGSVELTLKTLDLSYIEQIMVLQKKTIEALEDKEFFGASPREHFERCIQGKGEILGYVTKENELVAMGLYVAQGSDQDNYGYDIGLTQEELIKTGQIETMIVSPEYRGNGMQLELIAALEEIAKQRGNTRVCATAFPKNHFSVDNFKKKGYEIKAEKLKYGGMRRYIFEKKI